MEMLNNPITSQGAPSTIRCIKTSTTTRRNALNMSCQGAPSTIRCIKTMVISYGWFTCWGQGAPSTIRCIKTRAIEAREGRQMLRQGAPSTIRCIKTLRALRFFGLRLILSGSTQHHQVH